MRYDMGFRYRKSINLGGGFRINLSKSGVGYSWGVKGYRVTKTAKGTQEKLLLFLAQEFLMFKKLEKTNPGVEALPPNIILSNINRLITTIIKITI